MSLYAPFRFLVALAAALLIAIVIASSSAHALLLGDAVTQSPLGMPLRVVIPVKPAAGESLDSTCFRLVPTTGGTGAPIVTGRVSLERAAATPRLVVSTPNAISEPAVQFAIQAGCDGTIRRNYVLLLDPPAAIAAATPRPTTAREPGQERLNAALSTARRNATGSPQSEPRAVPRAVANASSAAPRAAAGASSAPPVAVAVPATVAPVAQENVVSASPAPAVFRRVAAPILRAEAAPTVSRPRAVEQDDEDNLWWYLAAPLVAIGAIALGTLFVRRRRAALAVPDWTRGAAHDGPHSFTDLSALLVTLPNTNAGQRPSSANRTTASPSLPRTTTMHDISTLDTLLNTSDADLVEERAVREAFAAARSEAERDADDNTVLRAIEEAERELLFAPPVPAHAAIETSLDEDLLAAPRRSDRAAA